MLNFLWRQYARPRDERGAVAIIVASFIAIVLPPLLALTVDVGVQRVAARDMQSVADMVAIDLARRLDGRDAAALKPILDAALVKSVARNTSNMGTYPQVTYKLGKLTNGTFSETTVAPTAIKVSATTDVNQFFSNDALQTKTSIAENQSHSCIKLGTYVLGFNGSGSPVLKPIMEGLLGGSASVSALGYEGLGNASVTLGQLATYLNLASTDALLNTNVTLSQLIDANIKALEAQGSTFNAQIATLKLINASGSATLNQTVKLGNIIKTDVGNSSALSTSVDVLSMIYTSLVLIDNGAAIAVPALNVGPLVAKLYISEGLQIGCNRNNAKASAVRLELEGNTNVTLAGELGVAQVRMKYTVDLAKATGVIANNGCLNPQPSSTTVTILSNQVATITPTYSVTVLSGLIAVNITQNPASGGAIAGTVTVPNGPYNANGLTNPVAAGNGTLSLSSLTNANVNVTLLGSSLLSPLLSGVTTTLLGALNPIVASVNTLVNTTLGPTLGINVGGLDVYGVKQPVCNLSSLKQ